MPQELKDVSQQIAEVAERYHYHDPPSFLVSLQELITRAIRWLKDFLESLHIFTPGFSDTRMVGNVMQILLYMVGIVCAVLLIFAVWSRLHRLTAQSQLAKGGALTSEGMLDSAGWLEEAGKLKAQGKYKESCRALYFSLLRLLDEKGIFAFAPTRTNYEYWYALVRHKEIQRYFRELADRVELVWFGNKNADAADYDYCLELLKTATRETEAAAQAMAASGSAAP